MAADHFCLIWNNFQNSILSALGSLQDSQDLVDVTLMCEGQNVRAHKVILSACSPYFRNLFKETPCQHPVIILKDVSHYDLTALLQFMYQGEVLITQECLSSFLKTAELLQVSGLAGAAAAASSVVTNPNNGPPRVTPDNINAPDSPGTVINKLNSELSLRKPKDKNTDKEKNEKSTNKYVTETDPRQSCSYDLTDECITVKTEADDGDFEEMVTQPTDIKHGEDQFDDTSTHSEEPSILERSLKAHSGDHLMTIDSVCSLQEQNSERSLTGLTENRSEHNLRKHLQISYAAYMERSISRTPKNRAKYRNLNTYRKTRKSCRSSSRIQKSEKSNQENKDKKVQSKHSCPKCFKKYLLKSRLNSHKHVCKGLQYKI